MDSATRDKIVAILGGGSEMAIATVRPDGFPQATTVSYVHDGVTLYFGTAADSQKARNIALNDKVSLTVNLPYDRTEEILGLSMGALAARVTDPAEIANVGELMLKRFPEGADCPRRRRHPLTLGSAEPPCAV